MYKFSCSKEANAGTCQKYGITKFPALRIFHHNGQMEAPAEYFGQFYSDQIEEFIWEKIREPFSLAPDTNTLLDFMLTKALTGKHMFVISEKRRPAQFLYKLGKKYFGKFNIIVQLNCDLDEFDKYKQVTF